jgi:hypothetical protein
MRRGARSSDTADKQAPPSPVPPSATSAAMGRGHRGVWQVGVDWAPWSGCSAQTCAQENDVPAGDREASCGDRLSLSHPQLGTLEQGGHIQVLHGGHDVAAHSQHRCACTLYFYKVERICDVPNPGTLDDQVDAIPGGLPNTARGKHIVYACAIWGWGGQSAKSVQSKRCYNRAVP